MDVEPEASTMAEALGEWTVATAMTEAVATEATSSGDLAGFSAATAQCKMMRFDREYGVSDAYQGMREVFGGRPVINTTSLGVGSRLVLCGRKSGQQAVSVEVISCYDVKDIRNQVPIRGSLLHIRVVADHLHTPADKKASLGSPAHWTVNSRNWVRFLAAVGRQHGVV
jgi:hypothetical protein